MSRIINTKLWLCLLCLLSGHVSAQTLEYWFDDHYDQSATTSIATSDAEQTLYLDLRDNNKFPIGFHKLNMRIIIDGKASAVYSSGVLKLTAGNVSELEYWVDDNGHKKTLGVKGLNDDGAYLFLDSLDLSDVAPGYHKLYYRAVSNSKRTTSAVSSTPIMVKSKYNVEDTEALKVTEQAYWIDDEDPEIISVARPKNVINQPYAIDIRKLSDGKHTLHLQYANSAGIWNGPVSKTFTKIKVDEPKIEATASVDNGIVTMKFNSVPYGYVYSLIRQYPSGTKRNVENINNSEYPATLQATDEPALGKYVYYVEGRYTDADGKIQKVCSNEINLNIENVSDKVKRGNIHGILKLNGIPMNYCRYSILINGKEYNYGYDTEVSYTGTFKVKNIPYGTEVTIGIKHPTYYFKDMTLIVSENTVNSCLMFDGTEEEPEYDPQPDNTTYDLRLCSKSHITPNAWEVSVKNMWNRPWSGNIIVKVIKKEIKDYYDKAENPSFWDFILDENAVPVRENVYTTVVDMHVDFKKLEEKDLALKIIDLPEGKQNEDYYVYIFSKFDGAEQMKELYGDEDDFYISHPNPFILNFNPSDYVTAIERGFVEYMKGYAEVMKIIKKFSDWGDPFKLSIESIGERNFELWVKNYEKELDIKELMEDQLDVALRSSGLLLNCFVNDMDKAVKKYMTDFKGTATYRIHEQIGGLYDKISKVYNASQTDDNHKFFELAKLVLKFSKEKGFIDDPVVKIYKTYFEVGEKMINSIEELSNITTAHEIWNRLYNGNGIYKIKVRKYSNNSYEGGYFNGRNFYPEKGIYGIYTNHSGQIESVMIELIDPTYRSYRTTSKPLTDANVELGIDGVTIKNVKFENDNISFVGVEAWMIIKWKNGRVTRVPLLDDNFVKIENRKAGEDVPLIMTVEFQSETYMNVESIPNHLTFIEP